MASEGWVSACTDASTAKPGCDGRTPIPVVFQGHQDPKETKAMRGWRVNLAFPACLACEVRNGTSMVPVTLQAFTQSP